VGGGRRRVRFAGPEHDHVRSNLDILGHLAWLPIARNQSMQGIEQIARYRYSTPGEDSCAGILVA
jgi:hypothetical protein